jgi:hypothetical protein
MTFQAVLYLGPTEINGQPADQAQDKCEYCPRHPAMKQQGRAGASGKTQIQNSEQDDPAPKAVDQLAKAFRQLHFLQPVPFHKSKWT